ncbi:MAG: hypothetical protein JEZ00_05360 [Anaerolineaceae bacterium]|nr:hypothetical protein [Anaerolineaceae bacterium]
MSNGLTETASADYSDATLQSFIVRVWKEKTGDNAQPVIWRGHITPIPKGNRHYFTELKEIQTFIVTYLENSG